MAISPCCRLNPGQAPRSTYISKSGFPRFHTALSRCTLLWPAAETTATSSATTAPSPAAPAGAAATASLVRNLLAGLVLGLDAVVDEQGVERQRVGQDEIANHGTADVHRVKGDGV